MLCNLGQHQGLHRVLRPREPERAQQQSHGGDHGQPGQLADTRQPSCAQVQSSHVENDRWVFNYLST